MTDIFLQRLERINHVAGDRSGSGIHGLGSLQRGIEKESLRVDANGYLANSDHPRGLGSALTNPVITTDYSEALLELVTPVFDNASDALGYLRDLHTFVYQNIGDEQLWCTSMPCIVPRDELVPIARYGTSNVGRMKEVYRRGLGYRYGRIMQTIAGIHYNVSIPERFWELDAAHGLLQDDTSITATSGYRSARYFDLVRNVHRYTWLLLYLFGASPAVCKSFLSDADHKLDELDNGTLYGPYATSLRMSDLGYQNNAQDNLDIRYNDLESYTESLIRATRTTHEPYEEIGVQVDGEWRQLNTNVIQIENEYYAPVRPKRVTRTGEKPSRALLERGVEYIEIRCMDLDPFAYAGIELETMHFLDVFTVFCLLENSDPITIQDQQRFTANQARVVRNGRDPAVRIDTGTAMRDLNEYGVEILERMAMVAKLMDDDTASNQHSIAVQGCMDSLKDAEKTPSAVILKQMTSRGERFNDFASRLSAEHAATGRSATIEATRAAELQKGAADSLIGQQELETADELSFGEYLERYFDQP